MAAFRSSIKFQDTGYFSRIICDYLDQNGEIREFYNHYPDIKGFAKQIREKKEAYPKVFREVLQNAIRHQYREIEISAPTAKHIELLSGENTFTVTTGHQLNLFTGPLYFLYKIVSAINLCKQLKLSFPDMNFVPVYWMASEDHDFDEIRFFNFKGNRLSWDRPADGPVGRLSTEGLDQVYQELDKLLGQSRHANALRDLFKKAYLEHEDLATATRYLANALFGETGLVILDGDDVRLKSLFRPQAERELLTETCYKEVMLTNEKLEKNYKIQVNPREINLFYIEDGLRERIVSDGETYRVQDTEISFNREQILRELEGHPERFSPNALLRPLYQETILPNLCYIGGGGELAYWMQMRSFFDAVEVPFPILLLRNSALLISSKQRRKLDKLDTVPEELFMPQQELVNLKVRAISEIRVDFSREKESLESMFSRFKELASQTDRSFMGAVLAQHKKQLNGLEKLEKRMLKAQRRKHKELVDRICSLQEQLFPNGSLQERQANFADYYEDLGPEIIDLLIKRLEPLKLEFDIIGLD